MTVHLYKSARARVCSRVSGHTKFFILLRNCFYSNIYFLLRTNVTNTFVAFVSMTRLLFIISYPILPSDHYHSSDRPIGYFTSASYLFNFLRPITYDSRLYVTTNIHLYFACNISIFLSGFLCNEYVFK